MVYSLYHGSNNHFKEFDVSKIRYVGCNGDGFYFASVESYAKTYGKIVKNWSVEIKNPLTPEFKKMSLKDYERIILFIWEKTEYKEDLKNYGYFNDYEFYFFMKNKALEFFNKKTDYSALFDLVHTTIGSLKELFKIVRKVTKFNFDGVISKRMDEYVVFSPKQIKLIK